MADEYVKREDAIKKIHEEWDEVCNSIAYYAEDAIYRVPAANVAPVVHSQWDDKSVAFYRRCPKCTVCIDAGKRCFLDYIGEYNFCPNCGADMREVDNG